MTYLLSFLVGGFICSIAQVMMDKLKLLPIYITVLFVTIGSFLEMFGLYDKLIAFVHAGVKVCARHRYESWWPRVKTQDLFLSRNECLLKRHFTDLCLSFPLSEKG